MDLSVHEEVFQNKRPFFLMSQRQTHMPGCGDYLQTPISVKGPISDHPPVSRLGLHVSVVQSWWSIMLHEFNAILSVLKQLPFLSKFFSESSSSSLTLSSICPPVGHLTTYSSHPELYRTQCQKCHFPLSFFISSKLLFKHTVENESTKSSFKAKFKNSCSS